MSYTVLARKYRPQRFSEVIGQEHVTRTLSNALAQQRIAHGYIFSGHRGIGKTTVARILAMALNCRSADQPVAEPCGVCDSCREIRAGAVGAMDVIEIDAATNRGIDEVRGLIATATAEPARDRYRIFILDEAHQVTDAAFNALLKTLEEPPPWVVFMMATTQPEDIPQTIRSRCQHFSFHAVLFQDIVEQLRAIAAKEGLQVDEGALALLAEAGDGSMRDALSIMDQAIACSGATLTAEVVRGLIGTVHSGVLEQVLAAVHANSSEQVLQIVDKLLVEGQSPVHFVRQMIRFLRNAVVAKVAGPDSPLLQISADEKARVARAAELFSEEDLTRFLQIMLRTHADVSYKQEQRFHLELGLLKLVHAQRLLPLEQLLSGSGVTSVQQTPPRRSPGTPEPGASVGSSAAHPSPFELDRSRKSVSGKPGMTTASATPTSELRPQSGREQAAGGHNGLARGGGAAAAVALEAALTTASELETVRNAILAALEEAGHRMAALALEEGEWALSSSELTIRIAGSEQMVSMAVGAEQRRLIQQAVQSSLGLSVLGAPKPQVRPGSPASAVSAPAGVEKSPPPAASAGGIRAKAAHNTVVRRMMEKFGAELRTVLDSDQ
jgi:DNA polymerase-3 subunit gamma/tau